MSDIPFDPKVHLAHAKHMQTLLDQQQKAVIELEALSVELNAKVDMYVSLLNDCHHLLNDCGYYMEDGVWTDPQDDNAGDDC